MLFVGSSVVIKDNSGAEKIKIINLGKKKTYLSTFINFGSIFLGVVKKDKEHSRSVKRKLLKKKTLIKVFVATVKKKTSRKNGFFLNFDKNVGIPLNLKNKRLETFGTKIYTPIYKEVKKNKILKQIVLKAKKVI